MNTQQAETQSTKNTLLITPKQASQRLGISAYRLKQLISAGEIAHPVLVAGDPRIEASSVENYIRRLKAKHQKIYKAHTARALEWMTITKAEEEEIERNRPRTYSIGDPRRLP